jgi:hypothetical protein
MDKYWKEKRSTWRRTLHHGRVVKPLNLCFIRAQDGIARQIWGDGNGAKGEASPSLKYSHDFCLTGNHNQ